MPLAAPDRLAEDVLIVAVVVAKLEFRDVERHIFGADFVECAHNAAFENRPEAFNGVGVDRADNVLALGVVNDTVRELFAERAVAAPCVGAEQAYFFENRAAHESGQCCGIDVLDNARDDLTFALNRADDWYLTGTNAASSATAAALIPMPVLCLAADKRFIDFHNAHELAEIFIRQTSADAVTHVPRGFQRTETHIAPHLPGADPLLADQHQVNDAEPVTKRLIGVLENRPGNVRESVIGAGRRTCVAEPVPFPRAMRLDLGIAASRTEDVFGPAMFGEIEAARIFIREGRLPLNDGHLMDLLGLFGAGHFGSPQLKGENGMSLSISQVGEHRPKVLVEVTPIW